MKCCKILAALLCLTAALPAAAQHTLTFRGDTVTWIRIEEDNSYREWDSHERVFPPEAWVEYYPIFNEQMLLKRNAGYNYKDFQQLLIQAYFSYLTN